MNKLSGQTIDLVEHSIDNLKQLFPEVVTEGKIDFDKLKLVLGENIETNNEKYEFTWNGKVNAIKLAQTQSMGTLLPDKESSENWDTTENLYIEGDNLEVLKLLQKSYFGKVKMIYIDPPYNTGKDFVYRDNFRDNIQNYKEQTEQTTKANAETSGRYHTDWLNMMYPRLKLSRNLLKDDGVIFVNIDESEQANIKKLMDEIFGEENIIADVIWQHSIQPKGYSGKFSVHHNYLLIYSKSSQYILNSLERTDEHNKSYSNPDDDPNGLWRSGDVRNALYRPNLIFDIHTPSGKIISPPSNGWRWSKETIASKISTGEIIFNKDETNIIRKIYLKNLEGRAPETIWFGKEVGTTREGNKDLKELFGAEVPFDTPKPVDLLMRILELSITGIDDIVLDFFSGSSTTAHAVLKYNLKKHVNLKYIMIQLPEITSEDSVAYKSGFENICEIGKARIRLAGDKIISESGKDDLDIGFKVFKLDNSNIKQWNYEVETVEGLLESLESNIVEGRTNEDLLYEIILKMGLPLTATIKTINIKGKTVYDVASGSVLLCLEDDITLDVVNEMLNYVSEDIETKVIFKEIGFRADTTKTNAIQTLKKHGIKEENVRSV